MTFTSTYCAADMSDCEKKVVLIMGGSRGIGREVCRRLARENPAAMIVAYHRDHEAAREVVAELEAGVTEVSLFATDVASPERVGELFQSIKERYGRLDSYVHSAARTSFQSLDKVTARTWRKVLGLNASAFQECAHQAAQLMRLGGGGRIVGLSSLGSRFALPGYGALGPNKAMMEAMARYMAAEWAAWGVNVNMVCGGFVETDSTRMLPNYEEVAQEIEKNTPTGRLGQPADLAKVVAFLCSAEADWLRGQTLVADGGYSLNIS